MKTMLRSLAALALMAGVAHARPMDKLPAIDDASYVEPSGDRVIELSTVVDAPPAAIWQALSTEAGWKALGVGMARVDLGQGGIIETSYDAKAVPGQPGNIRNQVLVAIPDQLLVIRNLQAPPGFAHAEEFGRTITAIELIPEGGRTRIRLSAVGYRPGPAYDALLEQFRTGDAWTLEELRKHFAGSPVAAPAAVAERHLSTRNVVETSRAFPDGSRLLQQSIVIHAPVETLWKAFADGPTFVKWSGAPVAAVDIRVGGYMEAAFSRDGRIGDPANLRHDVLAYVPGRLMVFRNAHTPQQLPGGGLYPQVRVVVQYADLGGGDTRVTVSGAGFGTGGDWDKLYAFFHAENPEMLETMKTAFETKGG